MEIGKTQLKWSPKKVTRLCGEESEICNFPSFYRLQILIFRITNLQSSQFQKGEHPEEERPQKLKNSKTKGKSVLDTEHDTGKCGELNTVVFIYNKFRNNKIYYVFLLILHLF